MTDPLSIAAGTAGLYQFADKMFVRTVRYASAVKDAKKEAQQTSEELQSLTSALYRLHLQTSRLEIESDPDGAVSSSRPPFMGSCYQLLSQLDQRLVKISPAENGLSKASSIRRKLEWPFTKSKTESLIESLERHKSTALLALDAVSIEAINRILSVQHQIQEDVQEIKMMVEQRRAFEHRFESIFSEKDRRDVFNFFGKVDAGRKHQTSCSLRHSGTGLWFLESSEFQDWCNEGSEKLWLSGIPGAGKTILASLLIEETKKRCENPKQGVAYFYCDYKDTDSHDPINILGSLAVQLSRQSIEGFEELQGLYRQYSLQLGRKSCTEIQVLADVIRKICQNFEKVSLIVDGVDECGHRQGEVSKVLASLVDSDSGKLVKIAVFSRHEEDISIVLAPKFSHLKVAARSPDLTLYVADEIDRRMKDGSFEIGSSDLLETIKQRLVEKADGMFRWVACQLDYLCELPTDRTRRKALDNLPPTLFETYDRILQRVDERGEYARILVQRTLYWILYNHGPYILVIEALQEALSVELDSTSIDSENIPSVGKILKYCSSLVRRVNADGHDIVELAHFTVKEYFIQKIEEHRAELSSIPLRAKFQLNEQSGYLYIQQTCLRYLLFQDFDLESPGVFRSRLANYAFYGLASQWWEFAAPRDWTDETVIVLATALFGGSKSRNYRNLVLYTLGKPWSGGESLPPLHFLSMIPSCWPLVKLLLTQGCDPNLLSSFGSALYLSVMGSVNEKNPRSLNVLANGEHTEQDRMIRTLLDFGATLKGGIGCVENGFTMAHIAALLGDLQLLEQVISCSSNGILDNPFPREIRLYSELRNGGSQITDLSRDASILHLAFRWPHAIELILERVPSLDVDRPDGSGVTTLHLAARLGCYESARILIIRGADVNKREEKGFTPLHFVMTNIFNENLACLLIKRGADVNAKTKEHSTPTNIAENNYNPRALEFCRERGYSRSSLWGP